MDLVVVVWLLMVWLLLIACYGCDVVLCVVALQTRNKEMKMKNAKWARHLFGAKCCFRCRLCGCVRWTLDTFNFNLDLCSSQHSTLKTSNIEP
jgi:hypothetical protein